MAAVLAFLAATFAWLAKVPPAYYAVAVACFFAGCSCEKHRPHIFGEPDPVKVIIVGQSQVP